MINTYKNISSAIEYANENLVANAQIQKIFSSSYYICFQIRIPGKTEYLYLGRGHGHEGLYFDGKVIESTLRKKDRFLEYLRKHLSSCYIIKFEMDELDRAFSIYYQKWGREHRIDFFYARRDLYFQNKFFEAKKGKWVQFQSWVGKVDDEINYTNFDELGRKSVEDKMKEPLLKPIASLLADEAKSALRKLNGGKGQKFLKRKLRRISEDLKTVQNYKKIEENFEKYQWEELPKKTLIEGVKFKFNLDGHFQRRDEAFTKIKKLKKAETILELRLKDTEKELELCKETLTKSENILKVIEPIWKIQKEEKRKIKESEYMILSEDGIQLAYGLSSIGNDQLRNSFASKEDWWFHLSDRPSTHVIVKNESIVTDKVLEIVGELLCELEKSQEVDIVYTQCKNLKAVKGKSGLVRYKKEKYRRFKSLKLR